MLFSVAVSRTRSPSAAMTRPRLVQDAAVTAMTSTSAPIEPAGTLIPTIAPPDREREHGDEDPVADHRQRSAEEERQPARPGVARTYPSVCW